MWLLQLNDMRQRAEALTMVAVADSREALLAFLTRERVEPYVDGTETYQWHKEFRRGGPLEWYNAPGVVDLPYFTDLTVWADGKHREIDFMVQNVVDRLPHV